MNAHISMKSTKPGLEQFAVDEINTGIDGVLAFFLTQEGGTGAPLKREAAPVYALGIGLGVMSLNIRVNGRTVRNGTYGRYGVSLLQPGEEPEYRVKGKLRTLRLRLTEASVASVVEEMGTNGEGFELRDISELADAEIGSICRRMVRSRFEPYADAIQTDTLLQQLIARIVVLNGSRPVRPKWQEALSPMVTRRVIDYIASKYMYPVQLQDLRNIAGLSSGHFLRAFTHTVGTSPHAFLMQYRLRKASEMICNSSRSLGEIAALTGFSHHGHLTRTFATHLALAPNQLRKYKAIYPPETLALLTV